MKNWLIGMLTVLILLFSSGCSDQADQYGSEPNNSSVDDSIYTGTADVRFSITPARPQPESPILIQLTLPTDWSPQPSQLVAITMYMGSLPVIWEAVEQGVWRTQVQVGACAEAEMEWQLRVPLSTPQGEEFLFFPLVTYMEP